MITAGPATPRVLQRIISVSARAGRGAEVSQLQEQSPQAQHVLFGISLPKALHTHGKTPFSRSTSGVQVIDEGHSWGLTLSS